MKVNWGNCRVLNSKNHFSRIIDVNNSVLRLFQIFLLNLFSLKTIKTITGKKKRRKEERKCTFTHVYKNTNTQKQQHKPSFLVSLLPNFWPYFLYPVLPPTPKIRLWPLLLVIIKLFPFLNFNLSHSFLTFLITSPRTDPWWWILWVTMSGPWGAQMCLWGVPERH